jgi:hypothetical protein
MLEKKKEFENNFTFLQHDSNLMHFYMLCAYKENKKNLRSLFTLVKNKRNSLNILETRDHRKKIGVIYNRTSMKFQLIKKYFQLFVTPDFYLSLLCKRIDLISINNL